MLSIILAIAVALLLHLYFKLTLYRTFLLLVIGIGISILLNIYFQPKDKKLEVKLLDRECFVVLNTFKLVSFLGKDGQTSTYFTLGTHESGDYVTFSYVMRNGEVTKSMMPIRLVRFIKDDRNEVDLLFYSRKKWGNIMLSILPYKETAMCYEIHTKAVELESTTHALKKAGLE